MLAEAIKQSALLDDDRAMDFKVDLSNLGEVAAKMPELLRLCEDKLREQKTLNEQAELLRRLVGHGVGHFAWWHPTKRARP